MFKYYIFFIIISILHELGHFIALKFFKVKVDRIVIGNVIYKKIKKIRLSPIVLTCYIDFSSKGYEKLNLFAKLIIIISGPLMNFIIFILLPKEQVVYKFTTLLVGVSSLMPVPFFNTDGMNAIKEILKYKKVKV